MRRLKHLPDVVRRVDKKTPDRFRPGVKGDPGSARPSHPIFFAAAPLTDPSASFAEHALPVEMNLLIFENDYQVHFVKICIRRIPGFAERSGLLRPHDFSGRMKGARTIPALSDFFSPLMSFFAAAELPILTSIQSLRTPWLD